MPCIMQACVNSLKDQRLYNMCLYTFMCHFLISIYTDLHHTHFQNICFDFHGLIYNEKIWLSLCIVMYPFIVYMCELIFVISYCVCQCAFNTWHCPPLPLDMSLWSCVGNSTPKRDPTSSSWCLLLQPLRHGLLTMMDFAAYTYMCVYIIITCLS